MTFLKSIWVATLILISGLVVILCCTTSVEFLSILLEQAVSPDGLFELNASGYRFETDATDNWPLLENLAYSASGIVSGLLTKCRLFLLLEIVRLRALCAVVPALIVTFLAIFADALHERNLAAKEMKTPHPATFLFSWWGFLLSFIVTIEFFALPYSWGFVAGECSILVAFLFFYVCVRTYHRLG